MAWEVVPTNAVSRLTIGEPIEQLSYRHAFTERHHSHCSYDVPIEMHSEQVFDLPLAGAVVRVDAMLDFTIAIHDPILLQLIAGGSPYFCCPA